MYNLIVAGSGWSQNRDAFPASRVLEFTADQLTNRFCPNGELDFDAIRQLPTLFVEETSRDGGQIARLGTITRVQRNGGFYELEYAYDPEVAGIPNSVLSELSGSLQINDWEFTRTHWAIKDVDLFRVLLKHANSTRITPRVFHLSNRPVNADLVSVMMPFSGAFDDVYAALVAAVGLTGKTCRRADNIWQHDAIIQDVVELICTSRVVICDLSGRNANVFYEAGIAHTLGKDVILITQSADDVPFDLRHLRYVQYLNNGEGRAVLAQLVRDRIDAITRGT